MKQTQKNIMLGMMALTMGAAVVAPLVMETVKADASANPIVGKVATAKENRVLLNTKGQKTNVTVYKGQKYQVGYNYVNGKYEVIRYDMKFYLPKDAVYRDVMGK